MEIKIIGLGGIGSSLAPFISRYLSFANPGGSVSVTLIDGDSYEEGNRDRQVFAELENKVGETADRLNREFPGITHMGLGEYVTQENIDFTINEEDLVLLAVDNHMTRKIVSEHCERLNDITLISGGNDLEDGNVLVYIKRGRKEITPPITHMHPEIGEARDKLPTELSCQEQAESEPQIFFANLEAAIGMCNALRSVLTIEDITKFPYSEVYFDINTNSKRSVMRKR